MACMASAWCQDQLQPHTGEKKIKMQKVDKRSAADKLRDGEVVTAKIVGKDTIPVVNLPIFRYAEERTFKSKREKRIYTRLKRDVLKVYPYAKLAGEKLRAYSDTLDAIGAEGRRKKYMKKVEEELKAEFGGELRSLTINQGRILIRLVDRETGDTSYQLVKELRGWFTAFFWQALARLFGHNLKNQYDVDGEDQMIEEIILLIETGVYTLPG